MDEEQGKQVTVLESILTEIQTIKNSGGARPRYPDKLKRKMLLYLKHSGMSKVKFSEMSKISKGSLNIWALAFDKKKKATKLALVPKPKKEILKAPDVKSNPVVRLVYKDVSVYTILSDLKQVVHELTK